MAGAIHHRLQERIAYIFLKKANNSDFYQGQWIWQLRRSM